MTYIYIYKIHFICILCKSCITSTRCWYDNTKTIKKIVCFGHIYIYIHMYVQSTQIIVTIPHFLYVRLYRVFIFKNVCTVLCMCSSSLRRASCSPPGNRSGPKDDVSSPRSWRVGIPNSSSWSSENGVDTPSKERGIKISSHLAWCPKRCLDTFHVLFGWSRNRFFRKTDIFHHTLEANISHGRLAVVLFDNPVWKCRWVFFCCCFFVFNKYLY